MSHNAVSASAQTDAPDDTAEALRISEYRYRNLFQAMAASFWELDFAPVGGMLRDLRQAGITDLRRHFATQPGLIRAMMQATRVIDVNDQTVALFSQGDKAKLLDHVGLFWPEASEAVFAESVLAAVSRKASYAAETRLRRLDGSEFDALFTACFPPDSLAKGILLVGVIDISARKQAQAALHRLQADMAHAARISMLGELTASLAHEVNQPLAAIATNGEAGLRWLAREVPDIDEVRQLTRRMVADARRAADIIARIRGMATRQQSEKAPLVLAELVQEAALFLRHELQAQGVRLHLDLAPDLPALLGDRTQLQQVVVNLALNAIQAMQQHTSQQESSISIATCQPRAGAVQLAIEDNGPGIAAAQREQLFESFYSTKPGGMGMGLPICRSIVEAHGGHIHAAAAESLGGARFVVTLPLA